MNSLAFQNRGTHGVLAIRMVDICSILVWI